MKISSNQKIKIISIIFILVALCIGAYVGWFFSNVEDKTYFHMTSATPCTSYDDVKISYNSPGNNVYIPLELFDSKQKDDMYYCTYVIGEVGI